MYKNMIKRSLLLSTLLITFLITLLLNTNQAFSEEKEYQNLNPKPASASVYNLGLKSYEQGDIESAVTFFKRAIDLDPNFVDAYFNLGAIYKKQKNFAEAVVVFQKAIDINPNDYEAAFELATCYSEVKNYIKAKEYFSSISPNFLKYNEVKQNLEKINTLLASEQELKPQEIQEPVMQKEKANIESGGQIFANTLGKLAEAGNKSKETKSINQLKSPKKDIFKNRFKVVTSKFEGPTGITKDSKNNIYIANFTTNSIDRITADGIREVYVEKFGIDGPVGLATDEHDNIYVANYNGNSITRITKDKEISVLVDRIVKPYYLFYDKNMSKLFATVQGNDALVEIDTNNIVKQPITSR